MGNNVWLAVSILAVLAGLLVKRFRPAFKVGLVVAGLVSGYLAAVNMGYVSGPKFAQTQQLAKFDVPTAGEEGTATSAVPITRTSAGPVRAESIPPIRFRHYAWNSHMGVMLSNGGKTTKRGSIMDRYGVKLELVRTDSNDTLFAEALKFAAELKKGNAQPRDGAHFFSMMADGTAPALYKLNKRIRQELGPEYQYKIFGSGGRSYGEDKFMGPKKWKDNPQSARGGVTIGVLQDGDINITLKWCGDNNVPVNPDPTTYDPDAMNFENAPESDFLKAAQVRVTNPSTTRDEVKNGKKTGHKVTVPIEGVATWTPGDELVVNQLGGLVDIADTKLYSGQMPQAIMGCDKWLKANRQTVEAFLAAIYEAGQQIKDPRTNTKALAEAALYSSIVYNEKTENNGEYWARMYKGETVTDQQGNVVVLGGSRAFNLADALRLFGLTPGSANTIKATYTVFGNTIAKLYPSDLPEIYPWEEVSDTSYLRALVGRVGTGAAETPVFQANAPIRNVAGRKVYPINFVFGKADFAQGADIQLTELQNGLLIAENAAIQINGYTDPSGSRAVNQTLSDNRAQAVASWLRQKAPANFTAGRVQAQGFGPANLLPRQPGESADSWHARCRRVEVIIGN